MEEKFVFESLVAFSMTYGLKIRFEDIIKISKDSKISIRSALKIYEKEQKTLREEYNKVE